MKITDAFKGIKYSAQVCKILLKDYGYFKSTAQGKNRDHRNDYIPWFTYPAIEALKNWDLSDKRVFEYGSGYSTLFWASRAKEVVSVEHNTQWYEKISRLAPPNAKIILAPIDEQKNDYHPSDETRKEFARYAGAIEGVFHIIVIDGYSRSRVRYQCAQTALPHLDKNGLVILDNSDWLPASAMFLRESGLIQIDFSGPTPGVAHYQTTSFFFMRDFYFPPSGVRQPLPPLGGRADNWERKLEQQLLKKHNSKAPGT